MHTLLIELVVNIFFSRLSLPSFWTLFLSTYSKIIFTTLYIGPPRAAVSADWGGFLRIIRMINDEIFIFMSYKRTIK